jgi:glycerol kinase
LGRDGGTLAAAQQELTQHYPQAAWVEHDAGEIWQTQLADAQAVLRDNAISASQIAAIGITNQRETTLLRDRVSGEPLYRAIVWQDQRTAGTCDELLRAGHTELFRERTGLIIDAYFSGTKLTWLLDHVPGARRRAERGELAFGSIDSWLAWRLSGGRVHVTDVSNAEAIALQSAEVLQAMQVDSGDYLRELRRWRRCAQRPLAAVSGRPPRSAGRPPADHRNHSPRRRLPGRSGSGFLAGRRRASGHVTGRTPL